MRSLDLQVLSQLCQWLQKGESAWYCTVIETWGSSPRRPGSLMVCHSSGVMVGTLSGGCVEEDLLEQLQSGQLAANRAQYKLYGETQEEIERFKLPCGGTLGVLIEPVKPDQLEVFQEIELAMNQRLNIHRTVDWGCDDEPFEKQQVSKTQLPPSIEFRKSDDGSPAYLSQVYGPETHLFIIGISEISRALAQFAVAAAYKVTVCDPRAELAKSWDIENTQVIVAMPDDALRDNTYHEHEFNETDALPKAGANNTESFATNSTIDEHTAIVALTHDPRIDDMGLMEAFDTPAFYIGAMGSAKSSSNRRDRLRQLDIPEHQLQRLHAPIGLKIGSKTPVEIAISIMAELIFERVSSHQQANRHAIKQANN